MLLPTVKYTIPDQLCTLKSEIVSFSLSKWTMVVCQIYCSSHLKAETGTFCTANRSVEGPEMKRKEKESVSIKFDVFHNSLPPTPFFLVGRGQIRPFAFLRTVNKFKNKEGKQTSVTNSILRISSSLSPFNVATKRLMLLSQMGATSCIGILAAEYCSTSATILH